MRTGYVWNTPLNHILLGDDQADGYRHLLSEKGNPEKQWVEIYVSVRLLLELGVEGTWNFPGDPQGEYFGGSSWSIRERSELAIELGLEVVYTYDGAWHDVDRNIYHATPPANVRHLYFPNYESRATVALRCAQFTKFALNQGVDVIGHEVENEPGFQREPEDDARAEWFYPKLVGEQRRKLDGMNVDVPMGVTANVGEHMLDVDVDFWKVHQFVFGADEFEELDGFQEYVRTRAEHQLSLRSQPVWYDEAGIGRRRHPDSAEGAETMRALYLGLQEAGVERFGVLIFSTLITPGFGPNLSGQELIRLNGGVQWEPPPEPEGDIMDRAETRAVLAELHQAEHREPPLRRVKKGTPRDKEERSRRHRANAIRLLEEALG